MPGKLPTLIDGPYATPRLKRGVDLPGVVCSRTGLVEGPHAVWGLTDGPIPWPWTRISGNMRQLIVCGDLERAIRTESVIAVAHHWGVSRWWVERARRMLGVERMNPGTTQLWSDLTRARLGEGYRRGYSPRKLTKIAKQRIIARGAAGERAVDLAAEYGVTRQHVSAMIKAAIE